MAGRYRPQCDANGDYNVRQCWGSTGYCWCVETKSGLKLASIEAFRPWEKNVDCGMELNKIQNKKCAAEVEQIMSEKKGKVGAFVPECDAAGDYKSLQCWASTGYCWCVSSSSGERAGEMFRPWEKQVDCDAMKAGPCSRAIEAMQNPPIGAYVPQCDEDGFYSAKQCWGSTGTCWCADRTTGEKVGENFQPWSTTAPEC